MRSYVSYIGGVDIPSDSWVYTFKASAMLKDMLGNLKAKRELERGKRHDADDIPAVVARCALTSDEDLELALKKAHAAKNEWAAFPIEKRIKVAQLLHERVKERREEFVDVLIAEGHPRSLAEWEVSGILQTSSPETLVLWRQQLRQEHSIGPRKLILVRKPDGVVTLSPPQNAAASNSVLGVPTLVAGNTLVVKAPRSCPFGVMFVWREIIAPILEEIGAPPGTLNLVCGKPQRVMSQWMESPLVDDIFFFGGSERGIRIGEDAVAHGKKPILELAGNDGCIVWSDADLDRAAEALTECFYGSGQICMVPKYAILHPDIAESLIARLVKLVKNIKPGYPEDPDVLLSPVLRTDEFYRYKKEATDAGAEVVIGGYRVEVDGEETETGPFLSPTVLRVNGLDKAAEMSVFKKETFFPMLPLVVPDKNSTSLLNDVIEFVNNNPYGLRNSVWVTDPNVIETMAARITNAGLLKFNDSHIGFVPWLGSHGGTGLTGGPYGELNYPLLKTSHLQGISIAENVQPKQAVFESDRAPVRASIVIEKDLAIEAEHADAGVAAYAEVCVES